MPSQDDRAGSQSGPLPSTRLNGSDLTRPLPAVSAQQGQALSTDPLPAVAPSPSQLMDARWTGVLTTTLPRVSENTTSQRIPVVIKGSMKKPVGKPLPPASHRKRRLVVSLLGLFILLSITSLALFSVTPLGHEMGLTWNPQVQQPGSNVIAGQGTGSNPRLIALATATAVYHQQTDGYDPTSNGSVTVSSGAGSLNWPLGQCTYWANDRYHQLTGRWVSWSGNADQWVAGARAAGWDVSASPHVPSIIVLMPGVQGASAYGHVAVVENIVAGATPVTVRASNMNWFADGGGWDIVSDFNFTVGSGVYFVWYP